MARIALAQCKRPADGDVLAMVAAYAHRAREAGADLLVFPESLMTPYDGSPERFAAAAEPLDGAFGTVLCQVAADCALWVLFTMNEANLREGSGEGSCEDGGKPFNTAVLADAQGVVRGAYRKVHLFDAQGYRESDYLSAGRELFAPVETPVGRLGMGICYDLRFPELARSAAVAGAQVLVYPAAWVAGAGKVRQWKTLLAARAVENGVFVAGCGSADAGRSGASCVFAPDGSVVAEAAEGECEELLVADLDLGCVESVRAATPSLAQRRSDLYR